MIPTAFSSSITASAARTGALMDSRGLNSQTASSAPDVSNRLESQAVLKAGKPMSYMPSSDPLRHDDL